MNQDHSGAASPLDRQVKRDMVCVRANQSIGEMIDGEMRHFGKGETFHLPASRVRVLGDMVEIIPGGDGPALTITTHPTSRAIRRASTTTFSVTTVGGSSPLKYQWYFNNAVIQGATSPDCSIVGADLTNTGDYFVVVSDPFGSVVSAKATLVVTSAPEPLKARTDFLAPD